MHKLRSWRVLSKCLVLNYTRFVFKNICKQLAKPRLSYRIVVNSVCYSFYDVTLTMKQPNSFTKKLLSLLFTKYLIK